MSDVKTPSGKTLTLDQLSNAEAAIRFIAEKNRAWLEHYYHTSAEEVEALVELAHERWYEGNKGSNRK